ncbi:hypothetical protein M513_13723, partial [Trichuris suis]
MIECARNAGIKSQRFSQLSVETKELELVGTWLTARTGQQHSLRSFTEKSVDINLLTDFHHLLNLHVALCAENGE